MTQTVTDPEAIDREKVRTMRQMLASEGGSKKIQQRYGEHATQSAEFQVASRQRQVVLARREQLRRENERQVRQQTRQREAAERRRNELQAARQHEAEQRQRAEQFRRNDEQVMGQQRALRAHVERSKERSATPQAAATKTARQVGAEQRPQDGTADPARKPATEREKAIAARLAREKEPAHREGMSRSR